MNYVLIGSLILLVVAFAIGFYRGLFGLLGGLLTWMIILGFLYVATPLIEAKYMDGAVYKKFYNSVSEHISTSLITKENKTIDSLNAAAGDDTTDTQDSTTDVGTPKKAAIDLSDSESLRDYLGKLGISIPKKASDFISKAVDSTTNAAAEIVSNITADNADKLSALRDRHT